MGLSIEKVKRLLQEATICRIWNGKLTFKEGACRVDCKCLTALSPPASDKNNPKYSVAKTKMETTSIDRSAKLKRYFIFNSEVHKAQKKIWLLLSTWSQKLKILEKFWDWEMSLQSRFEKQLKYACMQTNYILIKRLCYKHFALNWIG